MFTRRSLLYLTLAFLGLAIVAVDARPVMAQNGGGRIRLSASMSAGRTKAVAKYEQRSARRKFTFELEKGIPGTVITVRHKGVVLATRTIDALGLAKVDFDTTDGHSVPVMAGGEGISVWAGNNRVMRGVLR